MRITVLAVPLLATLLFFPGGQAQACLPIPDEGKDKIGWFYVGSPSTATYYYPNLKSDYTSLAFGSINPCGPKTLYIKKDAVPNSCWYYSYYPSRTSAPF